MKARLYIDRGTPLVSTWPETLTDGSTVWNLNLRGGEVIPCVTERAADEAFAFMVQAVKTATGESPLVL